MIRGLEHLISDFEHAEELEKIVVARATGNIYNHVFYEPLRMYFLENEELKLLLPDYIRKNRDIEHFWIFIKNNISGEGCYNNRRKYIYDSFQPLINYLEEKEFSNGSSLIKLAKVEKVLTIDQELNKLIEEAKERFKNPSDKKIALEKLWDAFQRIKTYFGDNKKVSAEELVNLISNDFDFEFINSEFKTLTKIGDQYNIRHHEKNTILITEDKHIEYLFFRMLALLNLCIENIHEKEGI
ncbi:hypothetical protein [Aliarcobacter butzleri]|uniref:hypothetical protein n=1 Tax=Aliarcobacter butzleri TaxID=28197 RepID=UPI00125EAF7D|nr:hypothetical protein [Aliarcobacter butzleri]MDN5095743.1 hypothetical protein [Aliarcobacter butzleri]